MSQYYRDYYWDKGLPYGLGPIDPPSTDYSLKIVMDPYRKYVSIESYQQQRFKEILYDSRFLDFRHLKPVDQMAWQKEIIDENEDQVTCLIRNHDDKVLYKEVYSFKKKICIECQTFASQGFLLSVQKLFYVAFQDAFNGVMLYDQNAHLVMYKTYKVDQNHQFTEIIEECWNPYKKPLANLSLKTEQTYAKN